MDAGDGVCRIGPGASAYIIEFMSVMTKRTCVHGIRTPVNVEPGYPEGHVSFACR